MPTRRRRPGRRIRDEFGALAQPDPLAVPVAHAEFEVDGRQPRLQRAFGDRRPAPRRRGGSSPAVRRATDGARTAARPSISNIDFDHATWPRAKSQFQRPQRPRLRARSTWARAVASARTRERAPRNCRRMGARRDDEGESRPSPAAGSSSAPIGARLPAYRSPATTNAICPDVERKLRTAANASSPSGVATRSAPALSARIVSGSPAPSRLVSVAFACVAGARRRSRGRSRRPAEFRSGATLDWRPGPRADTSAGASAGEAASASSRRAASAVARTSSSRAAAESARSRSARKCWKVSANRAMRKIAATIGGSAGSQAWPRPASRAPRRLAPVPRRRLARPWSQLLDCRARTRHRKPPITLSQ